MKRLASLEHNQTLSMHYIELQSGVVRDALGRVGERVEEGEITVSFCLRARAYL